MSIVVVDFSEKMLLGRLTNSTKGLDMGLVCGPGSPSKLRHGFVDLRLNSHTRYHISDQITNTTTSLQCMQNLFIESSLNIRINLECMMGVPNRTVSVFLLLLWIVHQNFIHASPSPAQTIREEAAAVWCCGGGRSRSRSRSRSPMDRKIRSDRFSYRDAPYRRDSRRGFSRDNLCKNCKRPGHYARECPNVAICHNCGLPGHIASECTTKSLCWNCREPGHMASNCPNEGICHTCGKAGHRARECTAPPLPPGDLRLCNNCYKQGHIAADCTNEKACNNCRKTGHLARDCPNDPICNMCNVAGHVARQCPKSNMIGERGGGGGGGGGGAARGGGYRDVVCRNCQQLGHMSRDCMGPLMICHNCGGRGHLAYECPSGRFMDRYPRRF
nr:dna-binding protein hexbp [Quercus suber]